MKKTLLLSAMAIAVIVNLFLINGSKIDSGSNVPQSFLNNSFAADHQMIYDCGDAHQYWDPRTTKSGAFNVDLRNCNESQCPRRWFAENEYDLNKCTINILPPASEYLIEPQFASNKGW